MLSVSSACPAADHFLRERGLQTACYHGDVPVSARRMCLVGPAIAELLLCMGSCLRSPADGRAHSHPGCVVSAVKQRSVVWMSQLTFVFSSAPQVDERKAAIQSFATAGLSRPPLLVCTDLAARWGGGGFGAFRGRRAIAQAVGAVWQLLHPPALAPACAAS